MDPGSTLSFRTFAITIRPENGVTDEQCEKFCKWVKRHCVYYHVITEKTGSERHIHSGLVLNHPKTKSNVGVMIKCLYKKLTPQEHRVLLRGVKIMYNDDFIKKYLDKGDDTVVLESCLPESGCLESFYPSEVPQGHVRVMQRKCSAYYHELEVLWYRYNPPHHEVNTMTTRDFLFKMMYAERCVPVIRDDKQIVQVARHLTRWLKKLEQSTVELPPFEKEE